MSGFIFLEPSRSDCFGVGNMSVSDAYYKLEVLVNESTRKLKKLSKELDNIIRSDCADKREKTVWDFSYYISIFIEDPDHEGPLRRAILELDSILKSFEAQTIYAPQLFRTLKEMDECIFTLVGHKRRIRKWINLLISDVFDAVGEKKLGLIIKEINRICDVK